MIANERMSEWFITLIPIPRGTESLFCEEQENEMRDPSEWKTEWLNTPTHPISSRSIVTTSLESSGVLRSFERKRQGIMAHGLKNLSISSRWACQLSNFDWFWPLSSERYCPALVLPTSNTPNCRWNGVIDSSAEQTETLLPACRVELAFPSVRPRPMNERIKNVVLRLGMIVSACLIFQKNK